MKTIESESSSLTGSDSSVLSGLSLEGSNTMRRRSSSSSFCKRTSIREGTFLLQQRLRSTSFRCFSHNLELAAIGNCCTNHLIDRNANIVYGCIPQMNSDPVFNYLINDKTSDENPNPNSKINNFKQFPKINRNEEIKIDPTQTLWKIQIENFSHSESHYFEETAILITLLHDTKGNSIRITDFCPLFEHHGRTYNPPKLIRMIKPFGQPRIKIVLRLNSYLGSSKRAEKSLGPNHITYRLENETFRLTTDIPPVFITSETYFVVNKPLHLHFGQKESLNEDLKSKCRHYFEQTVNYWKSFVSSLFLPLEWQEEIIRAAITLKLCHNESSGAIIAAMTTSIPESDDGKGRNWDYRYCWVRDSYHTVQSLNKLGQTSIMEKYLDFIVNILTGTEVENLQPLYGIFLKKDIEEETVSSLNGYRNKGPVRIGNAAYTQVQNDTYGSIILSVKQIFFDSRLKSHANKKLFNELEKVGEMAFLKYNVPDAGIWELRGSKRVHTHSSLMCWAACNSLAQISEILCLPINEKKWTERAEIIEDYILTNAWSEVHSTFLAVIYDINDCEQKKELEELESCEKEESLPLDGSLLLMGSLGLCKSDDEKYIKTVEKVGKVLLKKGFMFRYICSDDFGKPKNAFIVCTFWYIEALTYIGRKDEARKMFENVLNHRNHFGILSEDIDVGNSELWGNIPQTYSMVGVINSALMLSKPWSEVGL